MSFEQDIRDRNRRVGVGSGLPTTGWLHINARGHSGSNVSRQVSDLLDPRNDYIWAQSANHSRAHHSYFDYFFTGQDIMCFIDGVEKPDHQAEMPIMEFAFSVQQQKQPVYGFWSYTFDSVMRGNRIVNGVFRIATTSTDYMANMIAKAAEARSRGQYDYVLRGLDRDEENIETYWGRNIDREAHSNNNQHLFSSHPPFNMVVVYGLQSTSIVEDQSARMEEVRQRFAQDTPLMTDTNERLVSTNPDNAMRFVLENIELTGMQVEYSPDGTVCSEVYSFFARDISTPKFGNRWHPTDASVQARVGNGQVNPT